MKTVKGKYGELAVEAGQLATNSDKMHAVLYRPHGSEHWMALAMHANIYSCEGLALRMLKAWDEPEVRFVRAVEQFDFILRCGGLAIAREMFLRILRGQVEATRPEDGPATEGRS